MARSFQVTIENFSVNTFSLFSVRGLSSYPGRWKREMRSQSLLDFTQAPLFPACPSGQSSQKTSSLLLIIAAAVPLITVWPACPLRSWPHLASTSQIHSHDPDSKLITIPIKSALWLARSIHLQQTANLHASHWLLDNSVYVQYIYGKITQPYPTTHLRAKSLYINWWKKF